MLGEPQVGGLPLSHAVPHPGCFRSRTPYWQALPLRCITPRPRFNPLSRQQLRHGLPETEPMPVTLEALDLAALLCSRVCHDLISPVGAVVNGIEVMEDDADEQTKTFALDLIRKSAATASARLQFCRIAFGAAGSAGASIDTGDAEGVARGMLEDEKTKLTWS